ncbi:uncharacterized protein LOC103310924 [Acyrthosiphon pisum]|uniref:rhomboid protease n=1 Tax=Acyrthosiphon pisum TaxID=7029 RepID=A0A8R2NQW6_ACYPI|nr:uncharacterized protein LOC103310924 [Acyrthosiphon pisum]
MNKYFTINARQFSKASLLLSAFSHKSLPHLCIDMLVLYVSGRGVMQPYGEMGLVEFTAMYLISCVVSSLTSIDFGRRLRLRRDVIGASGAILSVVGYFSLANAAKKSPMIFLLNIQFDTILVIPSILN